jgi:thiosulfate reductase cytochrome b subunit
MVETAIHWSLLVLTLLYLASGLGITQYRIVEALTLGLLAKNLAFTIHENLLIPFAGLLLAHMLLGPATRIYSRLRSRQTDHGT